jgi:hypothetical protein
MARGGYRVNGGRKKKAATILRELCIRENVQEAEKSLMFIKSLRDDPTQPASLRVECAKEMMDRIWGKSKQSVEHSGEVAARIVLVHPK